MRDGRIEGECTHFVPSNSEPALRTFFALIDKGQQTGADLAPARVCSRVRPQGEAVTLLCFGYLLVRGSVHRPRTRLTSTTIPLESSSAKVISLALPRWREAIWRCTG